MYVEKYNREDKVWDALIPTVKIRDYNNKLVEKKVDFYPYRNYELFQILSGEENYFDPNCEELDDLSPEVKKKYDEAFPLDGEYTGYYDFRWTTLADLYIAVLEHPEVVDYDTEWKEDVYGEPTKKYKPNPLKEILDKIIFYVENLYGEWNWKKVLTKVRLVYWFDC